MFLGLPSDEKQLIREFEKHSGNKRARVARLVPFGDVGKCYWNCDRFVEQRGAVISPP
ncbi:MAG: hypothetical protein JWR80_923 [Bradyrhizobium sp.]|nr:hypothetical protein [Bradyrhizobium sp.]